MSDPDTTSRTIRDLLAPFGALRPQPSSDWTGEVTLPPSLIRFYEEVGPYGEDGPRGPEGLEVPTIGNPFWLPPLSGLWNMQAGYRWDGESGERLPDWRDEWLVVASQGGDPFILDRTTGAVLHARHGEDVWEPEPMFADVFLMGLVMGTIGAVREEGNVRVRNGGSGARAEWEAALSARLAPILGATEAASIAAYLD